MDRPIDLPLERSAVLPVLLSAGLLLTAGCGGGSNGGEDDNGELGPDGPDDVSPWEAPQAPEPVCHAANLWEDSAEPFEEVGVHLDLEHVDDHPTGFGVELTFSGMEDAETYHPVYRDDEGVYTWIVPPHPAGISGGEVEARFTDGSLDCGLQTFQIDPLPEAPGAFQEVISAAADHAEAVADAWGYAPEELLEKDLEEIPAPMIPITIQLWSLDHPDNPNALSEIFASGELPFDYDDDAFEFAEAVLGASGHAERLRERSTDLLDLAAEDDLEVRYREPGADGGAETQSLGDLGEHSQGLCSAFDGLVEVEINGPTELSDYMRRAQLAESHGERVETVGLAVDVLSIAPGVGSVVGSILSLILTFDQLMSSAHANLFPRTLDDYELSGVTDVFYEDFMSRGTWEDYAVKAYSPGWDATADLLDALLDVLSALSVTPSGSDVLPGSVEEAVIEAMGQVPEALAEEIVENIADFLGDEALSALGEEVVGDSGLCYLEPGPWGPIEIGTMSLLEFDYSGSIAPALGDGAVEACDPTLPLPTDHREFHPVSTGPGTVAVSASGTHFPPQHNEQLSRAEAPIHVYETQVHLGRSARLAAPGEEVVIEGEIEHAHDRRGIWSHDEEATRLGEETPADGTQRLELRMPSSEEDMPVLARLASRSSTGLRAPECNPPERSAYVGFYFSEHVRISPRRSCITREETQVLEADWVAADEDAELEWTSDGGTLEASGGSATFQADASGEYRITARIEGSETEGSARIRVGTCECFFNVSVSGPDPDVGAFHAPNVGTHNGIMMTLSFLHENPDVWALVHSLTADWEPGVYEASANVEYLDGRAPTIEGYAAPAETGTLRLIDVTEDRVQGTYSGTAFVPSELVDGQARTYQVNMSFLTPIADQGSFDPGAPPDGVTACLE